MVVWKVFIEIQKLKESKFKKFARIAVVITGSPMNSGHSSKPLLDVMIK